MGKLMDTLQFQLKTEHKEDAKECIQLYNYLFECYGGEVWFPPWESLTIVKFEGYPSNKKYYRLNHLGKLVLKGLSVKNTEEKEKIKIKLTKTPDGQIYGNYTPENKKWIDDNLGLVFVAKRHNINYYILDNGFLVHIYNTTKIT